MRYLACSLDIASLLPPSGWIHLYVEALDPSRFCSLLEGSASLTRRRWVSRVVWTLCDASVQPAGGPAALGDQDEILLVRLSGRLPKNLTAAKVRGMLERGELVLYRITVSRAFY